MAGELFQVFQETISSLTLTPGGGGVFDVLVNGRVVFSRGKAGRFPEVLELIEALNKALEEGGSP
jgi:selenoprotein W-related protein